MDSETRTRDEWLALRCQTNEDGAYEELVSTLEMPLLYYAIKLTGSRDRALDVMQEAWVRAFRGIRKLNNPAALRSWLYSIVHGVAIARFSVAFYANGSYTFTVNYLGVGPFQKSSSKPLTVAV